MIWIEVETPEGLSEVEALELACELWTPAEGSPWAVQVTGGPVSTTGLTMASGCRGFGHYLCGECASRVQEDDESETLPY